MMSDKEKARHCVPLELELAVPFLPAGDLKTIAAVSKACCELAKQSYQSRLRDRLEPSPTTVSKRLFRYSEVPLCYQDSCWWIQKRKDDGIDTVCDRKISFRENGSWTFAEESNCRFVRRKLVDLIDNHYQLFLPEHYQQLLAAEGYARVQHCSLANNVLFVIICHTTSLDTNVMNPSDVDEETTRMQLCMVVYDLKKSALLLLNNRQPCLYPKHCQFLSPPVGRSTYGIHLDTLCYGETFRSANGKAIVVLTALPGVDPDTGEYFREDAEIKMFNLERDLALKQHGTGLVVPCGCNFYSSYILIALSNGEEIASVATANSCHDMKELFGESTI